MFQYEKGRIFMNDVTGRMIAEITFPSLDAHTVDINHTFVDDSLRGQGVAGKLVQAAVDQISGSGKKAYTSCSYAASWMEKHPMYHSLWLKRKS
ncbi:MAG: GNAT family N-acetyltransferase [Lachnospiraceae bacterium]|nr:GNAT family N-acetyltransferase [Lachnospiraceae bacterium]MDY5742343.1 GNAT family N-acetyltransferase [Lachnospiraceae bacterium]